MEGPSPPVHTPINFLKGGGAAAFSANCVKLLADAGFAPEQFGSYDQLSKQLKQAGRPAARKKVAAAAARERRGETIPANEQPTDQERQLASTQVCHLSQNATRQRRRGKPCSNLVDGHDDRLYPCVAAGGPATDPSTFHGKQTALETASIDNRGLTREPGSTVDAGTGEVRAGDRRNGEAPASESTYKAADMRSDDSARNRQMFPPGDRAAQPTGSAQDQAGGPPRPSDRAQKSLDDYKKELAKEPSKRDPKKISEIDGETAAECVDTVQQMAEAAMKQKCVDDIASNEAKAGSPAHRKALLEQRQAAAREREAAEARLAAARRERQNAQRSRAAYRNSRGSNSPEYREAHNRLQRARRAEARAEQEAVAAAKKYDSARQAHQTAQNAQCRAEQGRRIQENGGRQDGRAPQPTPQNNSDATTSTSTNDGDALVLDED